MSHKSRARNRPQSLATEADAVALVERWKPLFHLVQHAAFLKALPLPPGATCCLCRQPASVRGMFWPQDSQAWGAKPGKVRVLFWNLCDACSQVPDALARVEASMLTGLRRQQALWN